MEQKRTAIIKLFRNGKNPGEIWKQQNFSKTRRNFIYNTIKMYTDTGRVSDKPRSGRPVSITTTRMRKVVRSRIWRNPRRSVRKMAAELKVSRPSLQRVVKRNLGLSFFKRRKVHFLSKLMKEKKLTRCKTLIRRFATSGLDHILFSDEKLFNVEEVSNHLSI